jgi:pantoate--beta-alanine ligase
MTRPTILRTVSEVKAWHEQSELPVAAVFTMGALHSGHAHLMTFARDYCPVGTRVIASIFVNPTQFNSASDLETYPRTLDQDLEILSDAQVDAVFIPSVEVMYPNGLVIDQTIDPGEVGEILEGKSRPGHFAGMLSVVNRLLAITSPSYSFFGEKDFQQLTLVKKLVRDLRLPIEIVGVPTVRDSDGLALSSRNRKLSDEARNQARHIPAVLALVSHALGEGSSSTEAEKLGREYLATQSNLILDYLEVRSENLITKPTSGNLRILIAASIDGIRLIDNIAVEI